MEMCLPTSVVITFDQNWHYLYSTSAGGKYLSNDAQIRVIGLMEPELSGLNTNGGQLDIGQ